MDLRGDSCYRLEVDKILGSSVAEIVTSLLTTGEYYGATEPEVREELLTTLLEYWVECEFAPLSNLMDVLQENDRNSKMSESIRLLTELVTLEGKDFRELRRSVSWLKLELRHESEQIYFGKIRLMSQSGVIVITICREQI